LAETFGPPDHGRPVHVELRPGGFTLGPATIESLRQAHGDPGGSPIQIVMRREDAPAR
jgi:hypothetical protein